MRLARNVLFAIAIVAAQPASHFARAQVELRAPPVDTAKLNLDPQVQEGFQKFYDLDFDGSLQVFEKVMQQHPADPLAVDYVLQVVVFGELYRQDLLDTTLYAHEGFLSGKHVVAEDLAVKQKVYQLSDQAVSLADQRLRANPNDMDALFARAMARSLKAAYLGLAERSFVGGLHLALSARADDERVLQLDPNYVDAEMVPGIHHYVLGALPTTLKIMAGMFGIHGNKAKGMQMLRDAAQSGTITSVESRICLMLFLRHDGKYQEAVKVAQGLSTEHPRNFLYALEVANLEKDAGNGPQAIQDYRAVLANAQKPGYYNSVHPELAWFGLGETLRGQNDKTGALAAFRQVLAQPTTGPDLKRRAQEAVRDLQHEGVR